MRCSGNFAALRELQGDWYWYLATPYSKYPAGIHDAFMHASMAAMEFLRMGVRVYCPISHTHPIAIFGRHDPLDHKTWLALDRPFMEAAVGLVIIKMPSWEESTGIKMETEEFRAAGKPIHYFEANI